MKPRIYRRHPLNRHLGRATLAEGVSKQNSHSLKVMQDRHSCGILYGLVYLSYASEATLIKAIGCVTGVIELLSCKISAAVNDVKV